MLNDAAERIPFDTAELDGTILSRFARVVAAVPDRLAVCDGEVSWDYRTLDRLSNSVAREILRFDTRPGGCVAYRVPHSANMILWALAAVKAGKAYLCIHPGLPANAQRQIFQDSDADLLITTADQADAAGQIASGKTILVPGVVDAGSTEPRSAPLITADSPAVLFYTSGSTGRPKGVVKAHRAVLHRAWLSARHDCVRPGERQSLMTYCSFASSEADVFGSLLNGATVELFDAATHALGDLANWIDRRQITLLHPPVVLFRRFLSTLNGTGLFPSVRLIALAGEAVLPSDLRLWKCHFQGDCEIRSRFSSTEAGHIAVASVRIRDALDGLPPATPVEDKHVSVIDEIGKPCAPCVAGEIVVRSRYLAAGYWLAGAIVRDSFPPDPVCPSEHVFRSGDVGRLLPDGRLEFLGRRDGQIKIRGYRVEFREIEQSLLDLPNVREAAVVAFRYNDENRLAAFVVGPRLSSAGVRTLLEAELPSWKVPMRIAVVDALPVTPTGKVDRHALAERALDDATEPASTADAEPGAALAMIWQHLLGHADFGVNDNFFDVGGHSLLAAQLVHLINSRYDQSLSVRSLLQHPTIADLACMIAGKTALPSTSSTVCLRPGNGWPPLFCLPPAHGTALTYMALARLVQTEQPVFALLFDDHQTLPTLEAEAARLILAIRQAWPRGPYRLIGHSYGSLLAFEIARQLRMSNDTVDRLMILDGEVLQSRSPLPLYRRLPIHLSVRLKRWKSGATGRGSSAETGPARGTPPPTPPHQSIAQRQALFRAYIPRPYAGRIDLFLAKTDAEWKRFLEPRPYNGWDRVCSDVYVHHVPGDHLSMMQPPNRRVLATAIRRLLGSR